MQGGENKKSGATTKKSGELEEREAKKGG